MGNCCIKKNNEESKENQKELKSGITVVTFAGPENFVEQYKLGSPPTFADIGIFTNEKKSINLNSFDFDDSKVE